ncbi:hypothetical protein CPB84DRAFT_1759143 [Gymnopilus junonius]|uniref:Uncharacterized protein n=1 Tax=Gymnopilus junonius TaxID=109634 RepID=A0A9P5P294_GYMJU|nr:hypothetical protein CPB84DRAFT_1759143 [Gymnopilus junonius]
MESAAGLCERSTSPHSPNNLISGVEGNASTEIKEIPVKWLAFFRNKGKGFAGSISGRLRVTEVSILPNVDDPEFIDGKVVCEIEVTEDMCNARGVLHEGCTFFLLDECSTVAMVVANAHNGFNDSPGVSQTINTFYHRSALPGAKLRIVSTSISSGLDKYVGKCEIRDIGHNHLVASGIQQMMPPSTPYQWMAKY